MSSRFPPPSAFNPRDRSPQRFGDRRPPAGPRGSDDAPPPYLARPPPRGPKALIDHPRGASFGGRGRGFSARGDFRDRDRDIRGRDRDRDFRDHRDFRDAPAPFRRDPDRDWGRRDRDFDSRDMRFGFRRARSRSPPPLPRDFRDTREPGGRDFDHVRMRRNSRDSVHSSSSIADGPPPPVGHHPRGGSVRGRARGRASYFDNRDSFRRRSRSRDGRWDRDRDRDRFIDRDRDRVQDRDRDRDRERDRDLDRRGSDRRDLDRRERFDRRDELDRRFDRDDRENDRAPTGIGPRNPTSSPHPLPSIPLGSVSSDRFPDRPPPGPIRKESVSENRREPDRWDPPSSRPDTNDFPVKLSPPPSAPQVPAFGSMMAPLPEKPSPDTALPASSSIKPDKPPPTPSQRGPLQPPTGPKAERYLPQPPSDPRLRRDEGPEPPADLDLGSRIAKPPSGPAPSVPKRPLDVSPPTAPAAMAGKGASASIPEVPFSDNPASTAPAHDFGKTTPPGQSTSLSPQTSPRMQIPSVPTGPRALQQRPPAARASPKMNKSWRRSSYGRAPSLPDSTAHPRRESDGTKGRSLSASEEPRREAQFLDEKLKIPTAHELTSKGETGELAMASPSPKQDATGDASPQRMPAKDGTPREKEPQPAEKDRSSLLPDFSPTSDEEEDERIVFTQDYLEERKQIFERDVKMLQASMPPPPMEDPNIVALLLKIQLLGLIANSPIPENAAELGESVVEPKAPIGSPAVPLHYEADKEAADQGSPMNLDFERVSVENLPFLNSGPPTPISDLEVYQENAANRERFKDTLRAGLIGRRKSIAQKNAALRDDYMGLYKPWRLDVWEQDRSKGKPLESPGPVSPPAPPIIPTPPSIVEGRRFKGNSELDFQNALRASEISAQEELERRRGNKATALPDLNREAVIPDMLEPQEIKRHVYKDSNNIVDTAKAMDVFGFLPPVDDFTPEEHEKFTNAFMAYPKKWGKIAESLPGRDFQQCIVHYYLTKEEIKYKAKLNKRWSRRGRAKRSVRPKSNALMADLGVVKPDYEGEEEPPQVTDTGRPRRAAAPTFGDSTEVDQPANARRTTAGKDGEPVEKPVSRRGGRGGGPGSRGGRRGRAAQLQQQAQLATEQQMPGIPAPPGPSLPRPDTEPTLDGTTEAAIVRAREASEREPSETLPRARAGRGRTREGMYVFESMEPDTAAPTRQPEMGYGSLQPTSYWSVPEQRDFPLLLAHFGRDFEGISHFMKTKTTVMVKNYFQRRIDSGQKDFEDIVLVAEGRKARGEPTGPLPVPSVAPKRRYEATPSAVVPRPLAPHTEAAPDVDEGRLAPKTRPPVVSPHPAPLHGRPAPDRERSASTYPPLAQASSPQMSGPLLLNEDPSRAARQHVSLPNRLQGPRLGYFTEERREPLATYPRAQESQIPPRHPVSPADAVRIESLRPSTTDMHGSPLLATQSTIPSTQQGYIQPHAQPSMMAASHSRQPSLTQAPSSPAQALHRLEPEGPPVRRDSIGQRHLYPLPGQPVAMPQAASVFSPTKEMSRPGSTAPEAPEAPRQVPAKRSNIMNILNDEPEEPQPRKKLASNQASPAAATESPSRPAYPGIHSLAQPMPPLHQAEPQVTSQQRPAYGQQTQYLPPPRAYSDYQGYGAVPGGAGAPANNDWMARFDPRGQHHPPPPSLSNRPPQSAFSPYASSQAQSGPPLANMAAPSPAPSPSPAPAQRHTYATSLFASPSAPHTQATGHSRQEIPPQSHSYRQPIGSPTQLHDSIGYGSRQGPPTPIQSPANLFGPRQSSVQSSYAPATPGGSHLSGQHPAGQQTYQQHVQTVVSGTHQQHPHRSSISYVDGQYGRGTPPPQVQGSRGLPGPSSLALGRSYTPPAVLPPNAAGGVVYAQGGPSTPAAVPPQSRHLGPLGEATAPPSHSRVYSQGSNTGPPSQHMPR